MMQINLSMASALILVQNFLKMEFVRMKVMPIILKHSNRLVIATTYLRTKFVLKKVLVVTSSILTTQNTVRMYVIKDNFSMELRFNNANSRIVLKSKIE